jgi:hypothetical protein
MVFGFRLSSSVTNFSVMSVMNTSIKTILSASVLLAIAVLPTSRAFSAEQAEAKPVATLCVAPLERSLPDLVYALSAMNVPEISGLVELLSTFYTRGLDRTKPMGMIVRLEDDTPVSVFCIPTTDHQQWFQALGSMGLEPEDLGDGLYELAIANQFLIARLVNNWLFIAESEEAVETVPDDPAQLFGDIPSRYNVAMRVDLENVSVESRKTIIEQMKQELERNVAEQFGDQLGDQFEIARESGQQIQEMENLLNEIQQVVLGVLIDSNQKKIYLDGAVQFMPDSELAQQMDSQSAVKSHWSSNAIGLPGSVMDVRMSYVLTTDQDKLAAKESLETAMQQAHQAVERTGLTLDRSRLVKEFLASSKKIAEQTIDEGEIDLAFSLSYENAVVKALMAARVADGKGIEAEIKEFLQGLSQTAELELQLDMENYKNWRLHRVMATLPASEQGMSDLLGERVELFIAASETMVMASLDPEGYEILKSKIDSVVQSVAAPATPLEMNMTMAGLVSLLQKLNPDETLEEFQETLEQLSGDDQVKVTATMLPRGIVVRMAADAALLRLAAKMARSGNLVPGF